MPWRAATRDLKRGSSTMFIGIGTIVLIAVIVLVVLRFDQ